MRRGSQLYHAPPPPSRSLRHPALPAAAPGAAPNNDASRARIVQRGAVPPLIDMLSHEDTALTEMAAFSLGRLAQCADNQVGGPSRPRRDLGLLRDTLPGGADSQRRAERAPLHAPLSFAVIILPFPAQ